MNQGDVERAVAAEGRKGWGWEEVTGGGIALKVVVVGE